MLKQAFAALGVVAAMATTSLAVVSPALAGEAPLERFESVEKLVAQPSVSDKLNEEKGLEQPLESPTEIASETLPTVQPSVSSLQQTEVVSQYSAPSLESIDRNSVEPLEPSQIIDFSVDRPTDFLPTPQTAQIKTEPSQLLEPSRVAPRSKDIIKTKPLTKPQNNIVPFTRRQVEQRVTRVTPVQVLQPVQVSQPQISHPQISQPVSPTQTLQKDVSRKASDLGGVLRLSSDSLNPVLPENPVVVEHPTTATQVSTIQQPEEKPQPEVTASVGVLVGTKTPPTLETAVGFSYEGYKAKVRVNQPLTHRPESSRATQIGIESTLPLSKRTSLTVSAEDITGTPAVSAKVEAQLSAQLSTSVTFHDLTTKPDVDVATSFQMNKRTKIGASLSNLASGAAQLNIEATHKINNQIEASASVSNLTAHPSVGLGIAVELSPHLKLEARANDVFGVTSYETRMTYTFTF